MGPFDFGRSRGKLRIHSEFIHTSSWSLTKVRQKLFIWWHESPLLLIANLVWFPANQSFIWLLFQLCFHLFTIKHQASAGTPVQRSFIKQWWWCTLTSHFFYRVFSNIYIPNPRLLESSDFEEGLLLHLNVKSKILLVLTDEKSWKFHETPKMRAKEEQLELQEPLGRAVAVQGVMCGVWAAQGPVLGRAQTPGMNYLSAESAHWISCLGD